MRKRNYPDHAFYFNSFFLRSDEMDILSKKSYNELLEYVYMSRIMRLDYVTASIRSDLWWGLVSMKFTRRFMYKLFTRQCSIRPLFSLFDSFLPPISPQFYSPFPPASFALSEGLYSLKKKSCWEEEKSRKNFFEKIIYKCIKWLVIGVTIWQSFISQNLC